MIAVDEQNVFEMKVSRYETVTLDREGIQNATSEIEKLHGSLIGQARTSVETAIRIGKLLASVRESLPHGRWLIYVQESLTFSDQTARNYLRVYNNRESTEVQNVLNLSHCYKRLLPGSDSTTTPAKKRGRQSASVLDRLRKLFEKASSEEQRAFSDWLEQSQK